jgi:hypothetical protein
VNKVRIKKNIQTFSFLYTSRREPLFFDVEYLYDIYVVSWISTIYMCIVNTDKLIKLESERFNSLVYLYIFILIHMYIFMWYQKILPRINHE